MPGPQAEGSRGSHVHQETYPTLSPQLPALSTLSKAKGGNKVAEALTGHVTLRFLQL